MRNGLISNDVSNFLHLSRWVAAFLVVLSHMRAQFFPPLALVPEPNIFWKATYFLSSIGYQSVIVFFIISGYLIGGEVLDLYKKNNFRWDVYLIRRVVRIYLVLIPALLITSVADNLGQLYFCNTFNDYSRYFENKESFKVFFINLFMLQHSYGPLFGSNDPLWSLAYEFWYYLMLPLCGSIIYSHSIKIKIISCVLLLSICLIVNGKILLYFSIWLSGALLWYIRYTLNSTPPWISYSAFVLSIGYSRYSQDFLSDFILGLGYMLVLYQFTEYKIINRPVFLIKLSRQPINKRFANFSYSLYLVHFPIMILISNMIHKYLKFICINSII